MVLVTGPLVEGGKPLRFLSRILVYAAAAIAAGAFVGAIVAAAGSPLHWVPLRIRLGILAILGCALALRELGIIRIRLPSRTWQVPKEWLHYGYFRSAILYGSALGTGFMTRAEFASVHWTFAFEWMGGTLIAGALLGAAFGFARGAALGLTTILAASSNYPLQSTRLVQVTQEIANQQGAIHVANGAALTYAAAAMIVVASRVVA